MANSAPTTATKKATKKVVTKKAASKRAVRKISIQGSRGAEKIAIKDNTVQKVAPEAEQKTAPKAAPKAVPTQAVKQKKVKTTSKPKVKEVKKAKPAKPKKKKQKEKKEQQAKQEKTEKPKKPEKKQEQKQEKQPAKKQPAKFIKGLSIKDAEKEAAHLTNWELNKAHTQIAKIFHFPTFVAALAFCAKITVHAEVLDHHPDIELSYGKVKVKLTTHHTGGLTKLDFALAERIDGINSRA